MKDGKKPQGRPPSSDPRSRKINLVVTATEHEAIKAAADAANATVSTFCRDLILKAIDFTEAT